MYYNATVIRQSYNRIYEDDVFVEAQDDLDACELLFRRFNRVGYNEVERFDGPSMSVGDYVQLTDATDAGEPGAPFRIYECGPVGWFPVERVEF